MTIKESRILENYALCKKQEYLTNLSTQLGTKQLTENNHTYKQFNEARNLFKTLTGKRI